MAHQFHTLDGIYIYLNIYTDRLYIRGVNSVLLISVYLKTFIFRQINIFSSTSENNVVFLYLLNDLDPRKL